MANPVGGSNLVRVVYSYPPEQLLDLSNTIHSNAAMLTELKDRFSALEDRLMAMEEAYDKLGEEFDVLSDALEEFEDAFCDVREVLEDLADR